MKKFLIIFIIAMALILGTMAVIANGATVLYPYQGGTGISSTNAGQVGMCVQVSSSSPFLYTIASCGSGGGGGSTTTINGITTSTFVFSAAGSGLTVASSGFTITYTYSSSSLNLGAASTRAVADFLASTTSYVSTSSAGTPNTLPVWTSASAIGNSSLAQANGGITHNGTQVIDGGHNWIANIIQNSNGSTIVQNVTGTTAVGNFIEGGGVLLITTSTNLTGTQFCGGGMFLVASTTGSVTTTITLPDRNAISNSPCGSGIWSGNFSNQFLINSSTANVTQNTSGSGEGFTYSPGTPSVLAPGQIWNLMGEFINTSTIQGATSTNMTFQVYITLYQTSTVTNALVLSNAVGGYQSYGGAAACLGGQAVTTISAVGGTSCATFLTTSTYNASITIATANPLGGGGLLSNNGTLNLTCSTCNVSTATAVFGYQFATSTGGTLLAGTTSSVAFVVPYSGTIIGWYVTGNAGGAACSATFDVWKLPNATPTSSASTITGSTLPNINAATYGSSTSLSGWTTSFNAGDLFVFQATSTQTCSNAFPALKYTKS